MTTTVRIPPAGDGFYAAAKRPENLTREQKGLDLFRSRRSEFVRISRDVVEVPSCTQRGVYYRVDFTEKTGRCSCPDYQRRHETCKHLAAAELYWSWLRRAARTIAPIFEDDEGEEV